MSVDVMGPYATPTQTASKRLAELMRKRGNQWWVPFPLNDSESEDFRSFLTRKGVRFVQLAPLFENTIEADRDLCPYVFAWRFLRGELIFTELGKAQYANKQPFRVEDINRGLEAQKAAYQQTFGSEYRTSEQEVLF